MQETPSDAQVFNEVYTALHRFAAAVRAPGVDADDLVQEALVRTLRARPLNSLEHPLAYLRTAVLRVAMNSTRSSRREESRLRAVTEPSASTNDDYPSDLSELWRVSPDARAVLFLTVVEGATYQEAGDAVGCNEAAARQLASRALKRLRTELTATFDEDHYAGEPT